MSKAGPKSKYQDGFAETIKTFIDCPQSIMVRGKLSDTKLSKIFKVDRGTIRRWRIMTAGHENEFHPEFAAACNACQEAIDTGNIKHSMVEKATGFKQIKRTREIVNMGPQIPNLSGLSKPMLIRKAQEVLELALDEELTLGDLVSQVRAELKKQEKLKLVTVKEEQTTMAGDVAAAKLVLNNIGKDEERWNTSDKKEVDGNLHVDGLTELMNEIDGSGKKLPGQS